MGTLGKTWKHKDTTNYCGPKTESHRQAISQAKQFEGHHCWKGDKVGYSALHKWVYRVKGRPTTCEHCGYESKKLQWANASGQYLRDESDWIRLCRSCHFKYDHDRY